MQSRNANESLFQAFLDRYEDFSRLHFGLTDSLLENQSLSIKAKQALRSEFRDLFTAAHAALLVGGKLEAGEISRKMTTASKIIRKTGVQPHEVLMDNETEAEKLIIHFSQLMKLRLKPPVPALPCPETESPLLSFQDQFREMNDFYMAVTQGGGDFTRHPAPLTKKGQQMLCNNLHRIWAYAQIELLDSCEPEKLKKLTDTLCETFNWADAAGVTVPETIGRDHYEAIWQKLHINREMP